MAEERYKKVKITKIIRETYDTSSFILEPVGEPIVARSGQFLTFLFGSPAGNTIRRSYSLCSSPELDEPLTVTVKRIPNGEISRRFVEKLHAGDELITIGASGFFQLPENPGLYNKFIFFAAGSGITPVFALLKTLLHLHPRARAVLIYSNRNTADTIFYEQIRKLQHDFPDTFEVHFLYSISNDLAKSRLTPALVENFLAPYKAWFSSMLFYVCGPGDYMRMIQFTLLSLGVPHRGIKREIFFVQQPVAIPVPADTSPHRVNLVLGEKHYSFEVQYPTSILRKARSLNIPVSFSCETGQCGTCVAKCLQGEVWMSRNEILLDEDIAAGQVLTCTGYPVNGDVTIEI